MSVPCDVCFQETDTVYSCIECGHRQCLNCTMTCIRKLKNLPVCVCGMRVPYGHIMSTLRQNSQRELRQLVTNRLIDDNMQLSYIAQHIARYKEQDTQSKHDLLSRIRVFEVFETQMIKDKLEFNFIELEKILKKVKGTRVIKCQCGGIVCYNPDGMVCQFCNQKICGICGIIDFGHCPQSAPCLSIADCVVDNADNNELDLLRPSDICQLRVLRDNCGAELLPSINEFEQSNASASIQPAKCPSSADAQSRGLQYNCISDNINRLQQQLKLQLFCKKCEIPLQNQYCDQCNLHFDESGQVQFVKFYSEIFNRFVDAVNPKFVIRLFTYMQLLDAQREFLYNKDVREIIKPIVLGTEKGKLKGIARQLIQHEQTLKDGQLFQRRMLLFLRCGYDLERYKKHLFMNYKSSLCRQQHIQLVKDTSILLVLLWNQGTIHNHLDQIIDQFNEILFDQYREYTYSLKSGFLLH